MSRIERIEAEIAKQLKPLSAYDTYKGSYEVLDVYEGVDFVLRTYGDKNSIEGGENITPNELYNIFETFHNWTK